MKKNVIIFFEMISRELEACKRLKEKLEQNNINAFIFSVAYENCNAVALSRKIKIDMIIVPWMYHDENYELFQPLLKSNPSMKIVNLHHEQIGSEVSEGVLIPSCENSKNSVLHFVWGEFFKEKLIESGVKENFIWITGNIRTDSAHEMIISKEALAKEFNLDLKKRWLLYSESRGWVLINSKKKDAQMIHLGIPEEFLEERKEVNLKSLELTIEEMNHLPEEFFEKYEFIYRPHPGTKPSDNINDKIRVIYKYQIYDWLSVVDLNIVWGSTTIFESDLAGVPSIVHEPHSYPDRQKVNGLENYPKISRLEDVNDALIEYCKREVIPKNIYKRYIGQADGKSVDRVVSSIIEILNEEVIGYKAKQVRYSKKANLKWYLFQKLTKLFILTNTLEVFKYPRSAYDLRHEIPYKMTKGHKMGKDENGNIKQSFVEE